MEPKQLPIYNSLGSFFSRLNWSRAIRAHPPNQYELTNCVPPTLAPKPKSLRTCSTDSHALRPGSLLQCQLLREMSGACKRLAQLRICATLLCAGNVRTPSILLFFSFGALFWMCWNQWNSCEFKRVLNVSLLRRGNSYINQAKSSWEFYLWLRRRKPQKKFVHLYFSIPSLHLLQSSGSKVRPFDPVAQMVEGFTCLVMPPPLHPERGCVASTNVRKFYEYSSPNHPTLRTGDSTGFLQVPVSYR